jgi:hypothetical protein
VDEPQVEGDVDPEPGHGGDERRPGVLEAAQHPGRREDDEHGGDAERRDAQVGHRLLERGIRRAEDPAQRGGEECHDHRGGRPEGDREPRAVDARRDRAGA